MPWVPIVMMSFDELIPYSPEQLIALAEKVSGRSLDSFFHRWLYVAERPSL